MKRVKLSRWVFIGLLLFVLTALSVWCVRARYEPAYNGKLLSAWLDDLAAADGRRLRDQSVPAVAAVTAIGTNALPWLIGEFTPDRSVWQWRVNGLLAKQSLIKFRFPTADERLRRAT